MFSTMNQDRGVPFPLSHQFRQHVRIKQSKKTCVSLQVQLSFHCFFFQEEVRFEPIHLLPHFPPLEPFSQHPCQLAACETNQT